MFKRTNKLTGWYLGVAFASLFIGGFFGPFQSLEHAGVNLYPQLQAIGVQSYYQGLTLHGVLNALVFTTFFIVGFMTFSTVNSLKRDLANHTVSVVSLVVMIVGLLIAAVPILLNKATVMFTFYPPLLANEWFYVGLTLVVVGSWIGGLSMYLTVAAWRKENPGESIPFIALASTITMIMWQIASLGVAVEMLILLIPWAFGIASGTDPQLARTLFWFTGHPIVYFWLLPSYVSWYGMMPKQAGGKLFSENLARLVFWLFLLLSIPVGFHHQFVDPGVPAGWKTLHSVLTYSLFLPSMLTAFTVVASLELGGRARGGKGLLGWIRALPWDSPSYTAQNLAMILFLFGGIGGLTNASYNVNLAIHNTSWIPGHFHLTVGSAATLTYFGVSYWLVPKLSGNKLFKPKWALAQAWTWFAGMILFSNGLHVVGLNFGSPRRTMLGVSPYFNDAWSPLLIEAAIGATILGISGLIFYTVIVGTVFSKQKLDAPIEMPVAEAYHDESHVPAWLDSFKPWIIATAVLILVAYGPMLFYFFSNAATRWTSPGFMVW